MATLTDRVLFGPDDSPVDPRRTETTSSSEPEKCVPDGPHVERQFDHRISAISIEPPPSSDWKIPDVEASEIPEQTTSHQPAKRAMAQWHPSLLQMRSIAGLSALCVVVACVFASMAVLVLSDNSPIDHWPIQPTVRVCGEGMCLNQRHIC